MGLKELFGTSHERKMASLQPRVDAINMLEPSFRKLTDKQLKNKTKEFRERLKKGETLDQLLPEAFATVREAGIRALGMRHFDVQLIGGMVLHEGSIAEMKTGEGKTLVASLPLYLNALTGDGAHLVTVNDYLASRDADWMGKIYNFLGLTVGKIIHGQSDHEKQQSYRCDICYGTNSEFGFDYLRDNMKDSIERYVQRVLNYAIVDEVDSILIDESRTPLIISGPAEGLANLYVQVNDVIPFLKRDIDFTVDEKGHTAMLTDHGVGVVEDKLEIENLYDPKNIEWLHHVSTALKAHSLYKRDVNYLVERGKVVIIDEFTGRKMEGRRWSDGLHQAIEAKENAEIEEENQTLATITYQNFFRMYKKLGGMTGTAETEAAEFQKIYKLNVFVIPTNRPVIRIDHDDLIYKNEAAKFRAVAADIKDCHERGQPVLVGTVSVEKTEVLSRILNRYNVPHEVLNAKNHWREADIVAQAGRKGAVTISTNMAGRGTDIHLGGNPEFLARKEVPDEEELEKYNEALEKYRGQCIAEKKEVLDAGGMYILGTERHESRRIDNQLRGRAGRQGDPGKSRFYISLEDDLMRIFGGDRLQRMMEWLKMPEDEPIQHRFVSRSIEDSQRRVEAQNFDIRKNLLEYDDVMNNQRQAIYKLRRQVLEGYYALEDLSPEEVKAGKTARVPDISGPWTTESLGERIRPWSERIIDFFIDDKKKEIATKRGIDWENNPDDIPDIPFAELKLEPLRIKHELYRHFGAVVPLEDELSPSGSRESAIEKCVSVISASLIQQRERILDLIDEHLGNLIGQHCPPEVHIEDWKINELLKELKNVFKRAVEIPAGLAADPGIYAKHIFGLVEKDIIKKEDSMGTIQFLFFARHYYLDEIDEQWIEHLRRMDHLREGIGLRGYAQKDPKLEYKKEGFNLFEEMMADIKRKVIRRIFEIQIEEETDELPEYEHKQHSGSARLSGGGRDGADATGEKPGKLEYRKLLKRVPRNGPCPCGSGKKYRVCHMHKDEAAVRKGEAPEWLDET
ncbi:preprotein translocase subunit SecA [Myxococcota bacterium]|nr:preprotein translocase subunit SecA [Myxococcota bacterium]MBU1381956.1 preprotein translocase subunit SecA [Myxococcota bacterium]MBU1498466.1 preprotein translocase subunit SecA [Myxococcota bacterium]